ncbi:putative membrane protein [Murinocardiopsis flavida]|uniref:Putative membrane protein n=1 Tax=Murinocardiopsis flavida TaxID=645275 RepID=A0A2P8DL82_9ACTN|nr:SRPBCC family protein [Murinocardiopsis flavida]PSK97969.1 putative membrane protein [Murinocardiopsis flavida]
MTVADSNAGPLTRLRAAADKNEGTAKLADAVQGYLTTKATSMVTGAAEKLGGVAQKAATGQAGGTVGMLATGGKKLAEGKSPAKAAAAAGGKGIKDKIKGMFGKLTGGSGGSGPKAINIVENIDVGVPVRVAYNQWTRFPDFGSFAKGVQSVEKTDDTSSNWKAKIFWSTRSWKASVTEQIQDYRIAWSSEAAKGTTKGVVTFHPMGDHLTRVLLVVEYYPKGLFERTGNIWRAQGRRLRLDLKHYRRQVMMMAQADTEELDGWRGEIREGDVILSHEDSLALEEAGLTDEQWDELAELDEDERAELAELDEDQRTELAELAAAESEDADDEEHPGDERAEDDEELDDEESEEDEDAERDPDAEVEEFEDDEYEDEEDRPEEEDERAEDDEYEEEEERTAAARR